MYAMETSSAVFIFRGTVIKYEDSMQMNVSVYLCPFDEAGSGPIQFMAHKASMALEESPNALAVCTPCLEEVEYITYVWVNVLMDIFSHTYPPKVISHHVECAAYSLVAFCIMKF